MIFIKIVLNTLIVYYIQYSIQYSYKLIIFIDR
jgi:hypothetical protein